MWVVMMVAMMLPSLAPMLWRYRQAVGRTGETRLGRLTALVGVGYFFVWTVFGMAAFPLGVALAAVEMQLPALARAVPIAVGVVVLSAGALQFTAWKAHHPCLLPGGTGARPYVATRQRGGHLAQQIPFEPSASRVGRLSRTNCFDLRSLRLSAALSNPRPVRLPLTP